MKCSECGAEIREGALYCDVCGAEVRIVPDYSPLDEVLTAHVRGEINGRIERPGESTVKREKMCIRDRDLYQSIPRYLKKELKN